MPMGVTVPRGKASGSIFYGVVFVNTIQIDPDDEIEDSDTVDGNGRVVKGDRNHSQGTRRGDFNCKDNCRMESKLSFDFKGLFHAWSM